MKKIRGYTITLLFFALIAASCKKETATFTSAPLSDYMPVFSGKYIHYRLDSTRFVQFGQNDTIVSYDAKDVVEDELTDNNGKPGFRVVRYLRHLSSTNDEDYTPSLTYFIFATNESVELTENNLRYQKLRLPIAEGFNWHGNSYLPSTPFYAQYQFSNDEDMSVWEYTYQGIGESALIGDHVYDSTVTVLQVADSSNVPIEFPEGIAFRNYWTETYAKNIGLIYKEVVMWEYQPPNAGNLGFRSGFGLKMTIIDHN